MRGLSVHQAPPFLIVAVHFLTACLFWLLSSFLEFYLFLRKELNLPLLVHTHLLGFALITMFGALFQMLPVVAGAVIKDPLKKALPSYLFLLSSVLLFLVGFLKGDRGILNFGATSLLISILFTSSLMMYHLLPKKSFLPAVRGFKFSLSFLLAGALFGYLFLLFGKPAFFKLHYSFMLWGWVGGLIVSVSFQVIETFYTTPPYPKYLAWYFHPLLLLSLIVFQLGEGGVYRLPISLLYTSYAFTTFYLLLKSKRKVLEYTPKFWFLGMLLLLFASLLFLIGNFTLFLFAFGLFFSAIIVGMMQRIIPFLVWFHLSGFGIKSAPLMFEILPPFRQGITFYSFLVLCLSLPLGFISKDLLFIPILFHFLTASVLLFNITNGVRIYLNNR